MTNPRRRKETPPPRIEQVVPQNTTAEQAALACLLDQADLSVPLTEAHFFTPANKIVFEVIKDLHEKGQPVTIMTVRVMLEAQGLLDQAGGDPSRYFDFGGGGNAVLDYYYHHLEDARCNRDALLFINQHMEDLSKCRINAKDFVAQLQEVV
jgi:replicative DNA helicase